MNHPTHEFFWFAVHVRPRREKLVAWLLRNKGFQVFLPLCRTMRRGFGRLRKLEVPLFPGYLFCRFNPHDRLPILITPGVHSIVGAGRIPVPIEEKELEAIRAVVGSGVAVETVPYLRAGARVRIASGPLRGVEGILLDANKKRRLVISVTLLQRSVAVEVDRAWVQLFGQHRAGSEQPSRTSDVPASMAIAPRSRDGIQTMRSDPGSQSGSEIA